MPTATFPNFFVRIDPANVHTKYEILSWDNRGTDKNGQSLDTSTLLFLQNFNGLLFEWTL